MASLKFSDWRFEDDSFDSVICLGGPLSHVSCAKNRDKAVNEMILVAKKDAPIFISVMGRLSVLRVIIKLFPEELVMPHYKKCRETGVYSGSRGFTACHFFLPEEFRELFRDKDVEFQEMVGLEGYASLFNKN